MQQIFPQLTPHVTDADLDELYAWPDSPWLRANMVSTVDGAAASPDGLSEGISSAADRRVFGRLRGLADVILVGAGTARSEGYRPARVKPDFAERRAQRGQGPVPAIAIVTRTLEVDLSLPLYAEPQVRTIIITCDGVDQGRLRAAREQCDVIVSGAEQVDLPEAVESLRERGLNRIHSEGGPRLLADLVAGDLLDELLLTVSPTIAGGAFAGDGQILRILQGTPTGLRQVRLHHLLEEESTLFASYRFRSADHEPAA